MNIGEGEQSDLLPPTHPNGPRQMIELRTGSGRGRLTTVRVGRPPMGPRRAQRHAEYLKRRALLGTEGGHNDMVDLCRAAWHSSTRRRAMLDRRRGVRR